MRVKSDSPWYGYIGAAMVLMGSIGVILSLCFGGPTSPANSGNIDSKIAECEGSGTNILVQEMTDKGWRDACLPGYWIKE